MSRRRQTKIDIDMFPFLSVLCSVIGVMMLFMLLVLSSRAFETQFPTAAVPLPSSTVSSREEQRAGVSRERYDELSQQIDRMTTDLEARKGELKELNATILELEELLALRNDEAAGAASGEDLIWGIDLEPAEDVQFVVDEEFAVDKKPRFLEVCLDSFILHPQETTHSISELAIDDSPLRLLLESVDQNRQREYLLLLIHPEGIATHDAFFAFLREEYPHESSRQLSRIGVGKEPMAPGWTTIWGRETKPAP